jgi:hypothetical protein
MHLNGVSIFDLFTIVHHSTMYVSSIHQLNFEEFHTILRLGHHMVRKPIYIPPLVDVMVYPIDRQGQSHRSEEAEAEEAEAKDSLLAPLHQP